MTTDPDTSATPPAPRPEAPRPNAPRRMRMPIAALLLAFIALVGVQLFTADVLDNGTRLMVTFVISLAAFIAVAAWFVFASGLPRNARVAGGLILVGVAVFLVASIRRVEFSGDMVPTFDFRWNQDRIAALEEHRTRSESTNLPDLTQGTTAAADVLEFRGPNRDGIEPGPALARDWKAAPPKLLWKQPVGGGYASFLVIGPALVTIEQRRDKEAIVAYDAATGAELWVCDYPALFSETLGGDGPRATPTFHDGKLYALGATGRLTAIDFASGKEIWHVDILKQNENGNLDWGMTGSPLVYDDVVVVNPGDQKGNDASRAIVAYSLADGQRRWAAGRAKSSYSSPMLVTLGGVRQLLIFDGVGLAGCDPVDGRELWRFPWKSAFDINAAQPIVLDEEQVVITSASGTALVHVKLDGDKWSAEEAWRSIRLKGGYASPIAYNGFLFGIDENILVCLDLADGKLKWKDRAGQFGHGQLILRDNLLLILGEAGELALVEATPERYHELGRIQVLEGKTWNVPVLAGNRIYVRNHLEMAAYELPVEKGSGVRD